VEITQSPEGNEFRYQVKVGGKVFDNRINTSPREFQNVTVYSADNWYTAGRAMIRNLVIIPDTDRFNPPKENTICKPDTDLYTYVPTKCNGWSGISIEDCKQKCLKNEIPENCTLSKSDPECHLIEYQQNGGWCQLGESCSRYEKHEGTTIVERKTRPRTTVHTSGTCPLHRRLTEGECKKAVENKEDSNRVWEWFWAGAWSMHHSPGGCIYSGSGHVSFNLDEGTKCSTRVTCLCKKRRGPRTTEKPRRTKPGRTEKSRTTEKPRRTRPGRTTGDF
jgi:hypothetical protein